MLRRWLKSIPVDWKVGEEKVEQEKMEQEKTEEEKIDNNERNQSMLYENNVPLLDNPSANEEEFVVFGDSNDVAVKVKEETEPIEDSIKKEEIEPEMCDDINQASPESPQYLEGTFLYYSIILFI